MTTQDSESRPRRHSYDAAVIEPKWQQIWREHEAFRTPDDPEVLKSRPKYYVLDMFPYPSGAGLHIGHPEGYTATDVVARKKRMEGYNVLHPMGWDAFGLPAERAAVRENQHPRVITQRNIANFRRQIERLGFSYDWEREVDTSAADYYRWTQWIFLELHKRGLAYLEDVPVWWCPALGTVLANEEVKDGAYVDTGDPVERRTMRQWMLRITAYAERLLEDLDQVDWPEYVKEMQRNWIGKSHGAEIRMPIEGHGDSFPVFTTRPDTLFGATYCVLAPEHPLVERITTAGQRAAVEAYVDEATNKTELQRTDLAKDKTGVFTGAYARNPATGQPIPIWVADYVLMSYGSGAIMGVPGQDQRDWDFAVEYDLPIVRTVDPPADWEGEAYLEDGPAINSGFLDGLPVDDAKERMIEWLASEGHGTRRVEYRLRDWLFSRQRYWGEPFPVLHVLDDDGQPTGEILPVPQEDLPVELPSVDEFKPTADGRPPLARAGDDWLLVTLPDGRKARRETNTMPQWAGSCWYFLRYIDPKNTEAPWARELERYWMPVDLYIGGVEHAVLHLLYARFWQKVLYDAGLVSTSEPFARLFNQGMILAYSYRDRGGKYHHPDTVDWRDDRVFLAGTDEPLEARVEKMSKSKLNVANPDDVIERWGADTLRLHELFMGPLHQQKPWQTKDVDGVHRFLRRTWRLVVDERAGNVSSKVNDAAPETGGELNRLLHKTVRKVGEDIDSLDMNTAISQMMIWVNAATAADTVPRQTLMTFLKVLSPFAPHLAEELWSRLGAEGLICHQDWPAYDPALIVDETINVVVQVMGKKRDVLQVDAGADRATLEELALASEKARRFMDGKAPRKVIVVPGRLVNIVV
ncbi:MAG: leucine--tRNA ligase [Acidobacteria bacterium]|nr:leucine--tRNA ligase [Acidobacteriota bacterium]